MEIISQLASISGRNPDKYPNLLNLAKVAAARKKETKGQIIKKAGSRVFLGFIFDR